MRALFVFLSLLMCYPAFADSKLPPEHDDDPSNNNAFERAINIGSLTQPDGNTPIDKRETGMLGKVPFDRFDTVDFYRFTLPANQWLARFRLEETPDTTMWIELYDVEQRQIWVSRGGDNEDFTIPLDAGTYFAAVLTDRGTAMNRQLDYVLSIQPRLVPKSDNAGRGCAGAPMLNGYLAPSIKVEGSLNPGERDFYGYFLAGDSRLHVSRLGRHYGVAMTDPFTGEKFVLQAGLTDDVTFNAFDPGYYCFEVGELTSPGPANYSFMLHPGISGDRPSRNFRGPSDLPDYDVGVLSQNGHYPPVPPGNQPIRYHFRDINPQWPLKPSHPHKIIEWLQPGETHWFAFETAADETDVTLRVGRINALVRAAIVDEAGRLVAVTSSNGTSLIKGYLPSQSLAVSLPAGRHRISLFQAGGTQIGTPYTLEFMGVPK